MPRLEEKNVFATPVARSPDHVASSLKEVVTNSQRSDLVSGSPREEQTRILSYLCLHRNILPPNSVRNLFGTSDHCVLERGYEQSRKVGV